MINNVNQTLVALMSKNTKKTGNMDANTDAFQSLLAALMSQGVNLQGNNMAGLQGELQGQLADMIGVNSGEMSTSDVFGINPALTRILSKLNGGTGDAQSDNGGSLKGFNELMKAFLSGKEQESPSYITNSKAVEDLLADLTQPETPMNPEISGENTNPGIAQENTTITREIADVLTTVKEKPAQSIVESQNASFTKESEVISERRNFDIQDNKALVEQVGDNNLKTELKIKTDAQEFKGISRERDFKVQDNKTLIDQGRVGQAIDSNLKAEIITKTAGNIEDKQFIVTRPEVLKILKGESTKISDKAENISFQNTTVTKTEGQDALQNVMQETELSTGQDSEDKTGEMPELKQDAGIQTSDMRSFQRVQETVSEVKQPIVANKEDVLNQVLDKVKLINVKDTSELHINLKPESLGEVSIKLVMEKGAVTARITVENSQVKNLIDSNLPQIKESLKSQNIDVTSLNVSVNLGQGDLPNNRDFSFNRWTFNKRGSSRTGNSEDDGRVETIKPREVYTQKSGLNILA